MNLYSGAFACVAACLRHEIRAVFAYPGTSELALCEEVANTRGLRLVNARGDAEAVFAAAGSGIYGHKAAAILHAARGASNAVGALMDARRNELGLVAFVGLPSQASAPFLPPHGEVDLVGWLRTASKSAYELSVAACDHEAFAQRFVDVLELAFKDAFTAPMGPSIVGIPQDLLESLWLSDRDLEVPSQHIVQTTQDVQSAVHSIEASDNVVILVDDYFFRTCDSKSGLLSFAEKLGAPILQVKYRRGPMLFDGLRGNSIGDVGYYDPKSRHHQTVMSRADLLIIIEDRNCYPRVIGTLPTCRKLVVSSNAAAARKNCYLDAADLVLETEYPQEILLRISQSLYRERGTLQSSPRLSPAISAPRGALVESLATTLRSAKNPILIDDSQIFGGLIASESDKLPAELRIFGDHGGFVGAGLGYAFGASVGMPTSEVWCLVGDQGFSNGIKAMVGIGEQRLKLRVVVCNNGGSVSLLIQSRQLAADCLSDHAGFLCNPQSINYTELARGFGFEAFELDLRGGLATHSEASITQVLQQLNGVDGPALLELKIDGTDPIWEGLWAVHGIDEQCCGEGSAGGEG
jgi:acetolactate synthase I/II/III large subunit